MEPKGFMGYPRRGSACELSNFGHEQYPSNSLNQNNWTHGVCRLPLIRYCFLSRFSYGYAIPFQVSIDMWWSPNFFWYTLREVLHMHCVILGTSNTLLIAWTKIIQSIMFTNCHHEGIAFLLGFVWAMQYPSKSPWCLQKTPNKVYFSSKFWYGYAIPLQMFLNMLWSERNSNIGVLHVHWIIMGISNTPSIAETKIIQSIVFIEYLHEGIAFVIGLNFFFLGVKKGFLVYMQD